MLLLATKTGLLCLDDEGNEAFRALTDRWVRHLAFDADGRLLAIVDDHLVMGRPLPDDAGDDANWSTLGAVSDLTANCVGDSGDAIFVGAADARMFVLRGRGAGPAQRVAAFDRVEGRDAWDTPWGGPPDVRSLAFIRDPDRPAVYADIHVGGIARSFDRGQTWSPARGRLHRDVHQVATHPDLPDSVFAATQQGFFRSDDRGESWSVALEPFLPRNYQRAVVIDCQDPRLVLTTASLGPHPRGQSGCEGMIFRSMDGGRTWAPAHDGLPPHFHNNLTTHLVAASRTRSGVFAFHDDSDGIFITTDAAATWRQLPILVPDAWALVVT